jgi:hypothetical protein
MSVIKTCDLSELLNYIRGKNVRLHFLNIGHFLFEKLILKNHDQGVKNNIKLLIYFFVY